MAILAEVLQVLGIEELRIAQGAMRAGFLYDMVGRLTNGDARERTVRAMQQRYHVDGAQAQRVARTAAELLAQVAGTWKFESEPLVQLALCWAARLHEMGLDVAHSGYHRHGAYLLENADMLGFSRDEQSLLARLVGGHRRKLAIETLEDLAPPWDEDTFYLTVLLRLAVLLHRGRSSAALPPVKLAATPRSLTLTLPARWLREHPLTRADLRQEIAYLRAARFRLRVTRMH